jgi:hypothetical protein
MKNKRVKRKYITVFFALLLLVMRLSAGGVYTPPLLILRGIQTC